MIHPRLRFSVFNFDDEVMRGCRDTLEICDVINECTKVPKEAVNVVKKSLVHLHRCSYVVITTWQMPIRRGPWVPGFNRRRRFKGLGRRSS